MDKIQVEFINTCPYCDEYGHTIRKAAEKCGDIVYRPAFLAP